MKRCWIIVVLCICFLTACMGTVTEHEFISNELGIDVSSGAIQTYSDTHGGFLGDGDSFAVLTFENEDVYETIKNSDEWSPLPLTDNLSIVLYGGTMDDGHSRSSFFEDENGDPLVPPISNGYYFFEDRHYESKDRKDDSQLFERHSSNFTVAVYDADAHTLYFCAWDS